MTSLSLNTFETALAQLKNKAPTLTHVVMNCRNSLDDVVAYIKSQIAHAQPGQLLFKLDLRVVFYPTGNADNWSLEACDDSKSLVTIGTRPTA